MKRRRFLQLSAGMLALPLHAARPPLASSALIAPPFTLGVAAGDPGPGSILLWTRLAPRPLEGDGGMPHRPAEVDVEVDARDGQPVYRGRALSWPETGHAIQVRVDGLQPGTHHRYRFRFGAFTSREGRFRTAPSAQSTESVRIAAVSCSNYEHGWFHAFRHIIDDDPDLVVHLGDYIYEKAARPDRVRRHLGDECMTLEDYRRRYAQYRLDPDLQDLHARVAFASTWDDHEVAGNWAGHSDKYGTPDPVFAVRRQAAFQAFREAMPLRSPVPTPGEPFRLHRELDFGSCLRISMLDTRQYRSDQACDDRDGPLCPEARSPERTMLGTEQEEWLERRVTTRAPGWHLIAQQVPSLLMDFDPGPGRILSMDKWDGYPAAQARFHALLARSPTPPVILAGDVHSHFAANHRAADGAPWGAELVTTSVTSGGDGSDLDPRWPTLQSNNPDLRYHSRRRGYLLLEAHQDRLQAEFRVLDRVSEHQHSMTTGATGHLRGDGHLRLEQTGPRASRAGRNPSADRPGSGPAGIA